MQNYNKIHIEQSTPTDLFLYVECIIDDEDAEILIPRDEFETWIAKSDKIQEMTWDQYQDSEYFEKDIAQYIDLKKLFKPSNTFGDLRLQAKQFNETIKAYTCMPNKYWPAFISQYNWHAIREISFYPEDTKPAEGTCVALWKIKYKQVA